VNIACSPQRNSHKRAPHWYKRPCPHTFKALRNLYGHAPGLGNFDIGLALRTLDFRGVVLSVRRLQIGNPVEQTGLVRGEGAGARRDPLGVGGRIFGFVGEADPAFAGFGGRRCSRGACSGVCGRDGGAGFGRVIL